MQIGGTDYILIANNSQYGFLRWNGSDFDAVPDDLTIAFENGQLAFTIPKALMANTQKIDVVIVGGADTSDAEDAAPNTGVFTYLPTINRLVIPPSVLVVRAGGILNAHDPGRDDAGAQPDGEGSADPAVHAHVPRTRDQAARGRLPLADPAGDARKRLTLRVVATVGTESRTQTMTVPGAELLRKSRIRSRGSATAENPKGGRFAALRPDPRVGANGPSGSSAARVGRRWSGVRRTSTACAPGAMRP